jgi:hypothetical protein
MEEPYLVHNGVFSSDALKLVGTQAPLGDHLHRHRIAIASILQVTDGSDEMSGLMEGEGGKMT